MQKQIDAIDLGPAGAAAALVATRCSLFRSAALIATLAIVGSASATTTCTDASGNNPGPCRPGREQCGPSFSKTLNPSYHLIDQQGCGENDPNSPVFDPVHGVIHHFYQIHVSTPEGGGPNYGHFVSKDFINWAPGEPNDYHAGTGSYSAFSVKN